MGGDRGHQRGVPAWANQEAADRDAIFLQPTANRPDAVWRQEVGAAQAVTDVHQGPAWDRDVLKSRCGRVQSRLQVAGPKGHALLEFGQGGFQLRTARRGEVAMHRHRLQVHGDDSHLVVAAEFGQEILDGAQTHLAEFARLRRGRVHQDDHVVRVHRLEHGGIRLQRGGEIGRTVRGLEYFQVPLRCRGVHRYPKREDHPGETWNQQDGTHLQHDHVSPTSTRAFGDSPWDLRAETD